MSKNIQNLTGSVKTFFPDKGFGFIQTKELGDVFFHVNNCAEGYQEINRGDMVAFDAAPSRRKPGSYEALRVVPA